MARVKNKVWRVGSKYVVARTTEEATLVAESPETPQQLRPDETIQVTCVRVYTPEGYASGASGPHVVAAGPYDGAWRGTSGLIPREVAAGLIGELTEAYAGRVDVTEAEAKHLRALGQAVAREVRTYKP